MCAGIQISDSSEICWRPKGTSLRQASHIAVATLTQWRADALANRISEIGLAPADVQVASPTASTTADPLQEYERHLS